MLSSSQLEELNQPSVQLQLGVKYADGTAEQKQRVENVAFELNADKFRAFLYGTTPGPHFPEKNFPGDKGPGPRFSD